ncbi:MAG: hypothetical protein H7Z72_04075 [Bacteroidetes bacterium]|nr:hypothetical protein [Fibrella sp.]
MADAVINHTGGITEYDYQGEAYTQFFLGSRYALLRPAFFGLFGPTPMEGPVFISLGGADPHNASLRVLENLRVARQLLGRPIPARLVLGLFHPNRTAVEAAAQTMGDVTILSNLTAEQMADELKRCQLAIAACSTVAYEVCAAGRPLIAIQTATNQDGLAEFFTRYTLTNGVLPTSGLDSQLPLTITDALNNSDAPPTSFRRRFFDKQTPDRFRHIFARLCSPTA